MGKLIFNMTMSLDGFVAGPNDEVDRLFSWYFSGDTDFPFPGSDYVFRVSKASADRLRNAASTIGAVITGRRNFNLAHAWSGRPPLGVPHVVLTHNIPQEWVKEGSPFTFVTDGIESAVEKARQIAGDKDIAISTANIMQQCLRAGLLDEIHVDLAAVLLGSGVRLFENLGDQSIELEPISTVQGQGVIHLGYRVKK